MSDRVKVDNNQRPMTAAEYAVHLREQEEAKILAVQPASDPQPEPEPIDYGLLPKKWPEVKWPEVEPAE